MPGGRYLLLTVLLLAGNAGNAAEKKQLLLVGQKRDNHPVTTHEFIPGLRVLAAMLEKTGRRRSAGRAGRWPVARRA